MSESGKVKLSHTRRAAYGYIRQSSPSQVECNRESTARQYALVEKACELGWAKEQVTVVDEDLGLSGSGSVKRSGFARMTAEVALGHVGIVLGLEVSRLARNNADWYRLLDLCGMTDTLIGDSDGIYHPALFNDRLILGLNEQIHQSLIIIRRACFAFADCQNLAFASGFVQSMDQPVADLIAIKSVVKIVSVFRLGLQSKR